MRNVNKRLHKITPLLFFSFFLVMLSFVCRFPCADGAGSAYGTRLSLLALEEKGDGGTAEQRIEDILDIFEGIAGVESEDVSGVGVDEIIRNIFDFIESGRAEFISIALYVFGIGGLMVFGELLMQDGAHMLGSGVQAIGCAALFGRVYPYLLDAVSALESINELFTSLSPVFASLLALGGYGATAAAESATMGITLWLYGGIGSGVLLTLCVGVLFLSIISSVGDGSFGLGRGFSAAFSKGMGFLTAAFAGITSLQSFITTSLDSAALRTAKYAAQTLIPVVGGTVSGAMSTLSGGLSYAAGVMGGGTVAALVSIGLAPLAFLLFFKLLFFLLGSFADYSSATGVRGAIIGFSGGLDALISVYTLSVSIYTLEAVLFLKSVLSN